MSQLIGIDSAKSELEQKHLEKISGILRQLVVEIFGLGLGVEFSRGLGSLLVELSSPINATITGPQAAAMVDEKAKVILGEINQAKLRASIVNPAVSSQKVH